MPGCDVYDIDRDARTYAGPLPVVAHPPCRAWGRLRAFAKPREDEKALAFFAIDAVRQFGGVLEHPAQSSLWPAAGLPLPGKGFDQFGGFTFCLDQHWLGHRARKRTWLYVVGVSPSMLPAFRLRIDQPSHVIATSRKKNRNAYPECSKAEREHTPAEMAAWLVSVAASCAVDRRVAA
ncbi:hypothetical protein [Rhodocyclus gracilis]|uniref:Uncharacterized protein n=1 Tax=Rhodocyclus tenuis TaxID=1066 RepID=A0A6L5JW48_RHOTE|nr:hypothetical protein [Rhodocyclus gracilis]MQY50844.1 hypothetical protein [Rhodocyclus gracilis]